MLEEAESQTLLGSYYSFKNDLTSVLMLNNKGAMSLQVSPVFYSLDGAAFQIPPLAVNAASYREIEVSQLLANAPQKFREGNLQIAYDGGNYQLGSQIKIIDPEHSLIWEEQHFTAAAKYISAKLEGVWWLPSINCETKFIITNTTASSVTATVKVDGTLPPQILPAVIELNPHQTRVLDVIKDLVGIPIGAMNKTGGVSISHTGAAGAVMARMLISKPDKGFSSTMNCIDPQMTASSRWHGAGLRIGKIGNYQMEQVLAVRNASDTASHVKGKFYYTQDDGAVAAVNIPRNTLAARSSKTIDLQNLIEAANLPANIKYGGIEIEYDTAPGSVVVSSLSHSKNENLVFQVPIYDPAKTASSAGGYPWKTDGDYTTLAYAKNDSDETQKFVLSLMFEGGGYSLGINEIKPHQTLMVDFKVLRDSQTPDPMGRIIPLDVNRGQIGWTVKGEANHLVNGRSEQFSLAEGLTSTYDCRNCCPNSFFAGHISPFSATEYIGTGRYFGAFEETINCYGEISMGYYITPFWQSDNTSVATINAFGYAEAVGVGNTLIQADWTADEWSEQPFNADECQYNTVPVFVEAPEEIPGPTVSISPLQAVGKDQTEILVIEVANNPNNQQITLTISSSSGTGAAQFTSNNTTSRTITATTDVEIKGITESSTKDNIRIEAKIGNISLAVETFTVILIDLSLRISGSVSSDNEAKAFYEQQVNRNASLGQIKDIILRCCYGVEIVGTVVPNDFDGEIVLQRRVEGGRDFLDSSQIGPEYSGPDTSLPGFRDDFPPPNGKIYDLDAPCPVNDQDDPNGSISRLRANFKQWATLNNKRVSGDLLWFVRISSLKISLGNFEFSNNITGDNTAGLGTTPLTWNLQ